MNIRFLCSGMKCRWMYTLNRHHLNIGYKGYEPVLLAQFAVYFHLQQKNTFLYSPFLVSSAVELSCERPIPLVESAVELSCERPIPLVESSG